MQRKEENGHVSFDPSSELWAASKQIKEILATWNPQATNTLLMITETLEWYGAEIDRAWSSEYSERTLKDAQSGTSNMLAAIMAGMEVKKQVPEGEGRVLEGPTAMGEEIALYVDPEGEELPCVAWAGMSTCGDVSFYTETKEEAHELYLAMLKIKDIDVD